MLCNQLTFFAWENYITLYFFLVVARDFTCGLWYASQECYPPAAPLSSFIIIQDSVQVLGDMILMLVCL